MLQVFESWGYELIQTSAVELLSTLELGVQAEQLQRLFKFSDGDGRVLALVGERTVPAARVAAGQLQHAALPLRLCYLGATFQGHPPPGGRRESFQAGAELIGTPGLGADAEVVAMAVRALEACGLTEFQVEVGHVGFFGGLMEGLTEPQRASVVDALAGRDLVQLERALAQTELRTTEQELLLRFPALRGGPEILDAAQSQNLAADRALGELARVYQLLEAHGVAARVNLDLGAVRDFDYYTGVIFEVFASSYGAPLAVGGRYDGLLERFGRPLEATGLVVFLDRVQELLGPAADGARPDLTLVGWHGGGHELDPQGRLRRAVELTTALRTKGRSVLLEIAPGTDDRLRRRAREVGTEHLVVCDERGAWLVTEAGREPFTTAAPDEGGS